MIKRTTISITRQEDLDLLKRYARENRLSMASAVWHLVRNYYRVQQRSPETVELRDKTLREIVKDLEQGVLLLERKIDEKSLDAEDLSAIKDLVEMRPRVLLLYPCIQQVYSGMMALPYMGERK